MKIQMILFISIAILLRTIKGEMFDSNFDSDFYADLAEFSCQDNYCNIIDLIGPPPDMILDIPPPPIPSFLKGLNVLNDSDNPERCNQCNQFSDQTIDGLSFTLPKQAQANLFNNSLLISIGFLIVSIFSLIALYIKYKKMKISMVDTCSSFSQSFFFKNKDLQVSSRVDNCAPVVNEKTPQSIITNSPSKKSTIIPAKYWKTPTGNAINFAHPNNHLMVNEFNGALIDSTMTTEMSEYLPEEGSCTSSPVYAELDSNNHQINLENMNNLITLNSLNNPMNISGMNQPVRYKAYTMRNYSEMPNAVRISQLNQLNQLNQMNPDTALLPEVSYDNEAYLPSSNSDYHNKSLKRNHRQSTLGKLGSKTPLLSIHCSTNVNSLTLGYSNNDKPKQTFITQHQLGSRINVNVNNTLMLNNQDQDQINIQPRYVQGNKKNILIYNGQPIISNATTYQQKRPLPKLPNNFI